MILTKEEALKILLDFFIDIGKKRPLIKTPMLAQASKMFTREFIIEYSSLILTVYKQTEQEKEKTLLIRNGGHSEEID